MENFLVNKISTNEEFYLLLGKFLLQNGYESENSQRGLKSVQRDYEYVFNTTAPDWVSLIWPSTALSVLQLAIATKKVLPSEIDLPQEALKTTNKVKRSVLR